MIFEWDEGNLAKSWIKHGVSADETMSVWNDENHKILVSRVTDDHELRFLCIGISEHSRLITVVFTYRNKDGIRRISSRPSNKKEKQFYNGQ